MRIWKQHADLETMNAWSRRTLMHALDIRITELGDDYLRGTMPVDDRTRQPYGILHGGASVALAETLGSTAAMLCCEDGRATVGLEINANHLRAGAKAWSPPPRDRSTSVAARRCGKSASRMKPAS